MEIIYSNKCSTRRELQQNFPGKSDNDNFRANQIWLKHPKMGKSIMTILKPIVQKFSRLSNSMMTIS